MHVLSFRLLPGQDLKKEIEEYVAAKRVEAGCLLTCVGSLKKATIRLADQKEGTVLEGPFEIVSLVGTLSGNGSHLHLCIADTSGRTIGGHLLEGCLVYTTAELVIGQLTDTVFKREIDEGTGFRELTIYQKTKK